VNGASGSSPARWNHAALWYATGVLLLAAVVYLSLASVQQPVKMTGADKYEHLLAYGVLMYWWGMVQPLRRWRWAIALALLGVVLELAQGMTPHRSMDWHDALANAAGVAIALGVLTTPAGRSLAWLDGQLPNRRDSRLP